MFIQRYWTWIRDKVYSKTQDVLLTILSAGPVPRHVAFVMDGNRRYARMNNKKIQEGHTEGFIALRKVLEICLRLNVRCVSAYAFSIENFKRDPDEVQALMDLLEEKLVEICKNGDLMDEYGARLNVLGRTELLPESVQRAVRKAEDMTRHNNRAMLNLCLPYTSRDEITTAVQSAVRIAVKEESAGEPKITEKDIDAQLMTSLVGSPPLDILVRTSGVKRLSDFLLWQCCNDTQLQFSSKYWPEFGLFDFVPIILDYQRKIWSRQASL